MHDYKTAFNSHQRVLAMRIKLFGEERESTGDSYRQLGITKHEMHDYKAALQCHQRAYSYFEKGCRKKCTRQSRRALWVV